MHVIFLRSWSSIINIAARLWAGQPGARILMEARDFSLVQNIQTSSEIYPVSYLMGTEFLSRVNWPKHEVVNHSSPSDADIKNWGYTSSSPPLPICLKGVDKESLTFDHVSLFLLFILISYHLGSINCTSASV